MSAIARTATRCAALMTDRLTSYSSLLYNFSVTQLWGSRTGWSINPTSAQNIWQLNYLNYSYTEH